MLINFHHGREVEPKPKRCINILMNAEEKYELFNMKIGNESFFLIKNIN